jgi:hypothetical protein
VLTGIGNFTSSLYQSVQCETGFPLVVPDALFTSLPQNSRAKCGNMLLSDTRNLRYRRVPPDINIWIHMFAHIHTEFFLSLWMDTNIGLKRKPR